MLIRHRITVRWALAKVFTVFFRLFLGFVLFLPLSILIPKKKSLIFITRFGRNYEGNLKYLYLYLLEHPDEDFSYHFLTESREIYKQLKQADLPVIYHPTPLSFWKLLRAWGIVVDGNEWTRLTLKYQLLQRARKFQLWHGSGMKTIGKLKARDQNWNFIERAIKSMLGAHPHYDVVVLPSQLQLETRGPAFNTEHFFINGQPRNDVLFLDDAASYLMGGDEKAYYEVKRQKESGKKVVLYAPTHRKRTDEFTRLKDTLEVEKLNEYGKEHNILFVFKYHPKTKDDFEYDISGMDSIVNYDKFADGYPLFGLVDVMITDYSSIFVDFILLDRPVIFFPFDYDHYVHSERPLQFDYETVTPGKKCFTMDELLEEIDSLLVQGNDSGQEERQRVLKLFYDITGGGSSQRMRNEIHKIWDKESSK